MKTFWTKRGLASLISVYEGIASEQPHAAERIRRDIESTAEMLGMWPLAGRTLGIRSAHYFPVPDTKYILLYRIEPDKVTILLVVHGAMDWRNRFM